MNATSLSTSFLATATNATLEEWGPLAQATGPQMQVSGTVIWRDGAQEAGVWQCSPGPSHWTVANNEFVYVLYGRMTVTADGGEPAEIGPGDTAVFPQGWSGTWEIHETIRQLYVMF